jgi:hypothetical protein
MPRLMDVMEVSRRTGLPIRRLRYVLEHRLLPGTEKASRGHRIPRSFTDLEGFGIACAAVLLQAGLRRPLVQRCIRELLRPSRGRGRPENHLALLQRSAGAAVIEIADGTKLRVTAGPGKTSEWLPLTVGKDEMNAPEPVAVMRVDIGSIRDMLNIKS